MTYSILLESCLVTIPLRLSQISLLMGLLSFFEESEVHHKVLFVVSSFNIYLSLGDRPVKIPVMTLKATN